MATMPYTRLQVEADSGSIRNEYERRLEARRSKLEQHLRTFVTIGNWRLAVVVAGGLLAWWNLWTLAASLAAFIALIVWHERIASKVEAETRAAAFYERGLARVDGHWAGTGSSGQRFRDPSHPYADDLDVFGMGSLFELISGARTGIGEETLAAWLKAPASVAEVLERQEAVAQLRDRLDLREDLALLGDDVEATVKPENLARWAEAPPVKVPEWVRPAAFLASILTAASFTGYMLQFWDWRWFAGALVFGIAVAMSARMQVLQILASVDAPAQELDVLARVFERFEREPLSGGRLAHLREELLAGGRSPSRSIAQLHRLIEYHDWSRNQAYAVIAKPLLWSTQFSLAMEAWRRRNGAGVRRWLAAVGELEALASLGGYAAEHPMDTFPELAGSVCFVGQGIAHPLLEPLVAVRNDMHLDSDVRLLIVSGSNMSGKSTLLRAVGLNTVLAWAGGPVRARHLRVSRLNVGASMRIVDSILEGKSRFYAEITRLRQVVDMAAAGPLLFLLDEVLSGTNSHDRRIGAGAILRTLVERGSIGLVTTHDLALADVAGELAPHASNVHFEDHLEGGSIAFDYHMRPGVVTKSNALELMRSVGLDV
jgi:hypothetical protein